MQLQEGITWDLHDSHAMQKKQTSVFPGRCCLWRKIQWCCLLQIILDQRNRLYHYTTDWAYMGRSHKNDNIEDDINNIEDNINNIDDAFSSKLSGH